MKQRRRCEHAIKTATRQVELRKIRCPYLRSRMGARNRGGVRGPYNQPRYDGVRQTHLLRSASGPQPTTSIRRAFTLKTAQRAILW